MFEYCMYKGVGVISYAPLLSGFLARPSDEKTERSRALEETPFARILSESDKEVVECVGKVAEKHSWKMAQVALAWSCTKVTSTIVGLNSVCLSCFSSPGRPYIQKHAGRTCDGERHCRHDLES